MNIHPKILKKIKAMRLSGRGYKAISRELGVPTSTVRYHVNPHFKKACITRTNSTPFRNRLTRFLREKKKSFDKVISVGSGENRDHKKSTSKFTTKQLIAHLGENPKCYLTGKYVDLRDLASFSFDHVIPRSKGGDNSLSNLGLTIPPANVAKSNLTLSELFQLCSDILTHNGYIVTKLGRPTGYAPVLQTSQVCVLD